MTISTIHAHHITKRFLQGQSSLLVFDGINCTLTQNMTYALTGVSGAGKSTLLHILAGLDEPTSGSVFFNNKDVVKFTMQERQLLLNKSFGLVFQSSYLISELSVIENIMMPGLIAGLAYEECYKRAQEMLSMVGLQEKTLSNPLTLSGGQQQRVAIVRALFNKPSFVFADEPTGNLDEKTGKNVIDFLLDCQREWHMGLVVSTHDVYVAQLMNHQLVLHNGSLIKNS